MKKAIGMVVPGDFKVYHALVVVNKTTNEEVETIFIKPKMEEEADFHHLYSSLGPDRKKRNKVAVKLFKALEKLSVKPKPSSSSLLLPTRRCPAYASGRSPHAFAAPRSIESQGLGCKRASHDASSQRRSRRADRLQPAPTRLQAPSRLSLVSLAQTQQPRPVRKSCATRSAPSAPKWAGLHP